MKIATVEVQNCINNINGKGNASTLPLLNTIKLNRNLTMSKSIYTPSKEAIETFGYTLIEYEKPNPDELIEANVFIGEDNGNYGNPTNYTHSKGTRAQISKNNSRYWRGKTGDHHHATGSKRPDSVEIARKMGLGNIGSEPWNKGRTDLPKQSAESNAKRSAEMKGRKKPKIQCPHCNKIGGLPTMKQWHFDKCKEK